ncbi:MAG: hypothetical protein J7M25_08705 [Deltaproteobacteria bacterium]|nr:hypothetical protein [Deltaproteobacteria bacterium]
MKILRIAALAAALIVLGAPLARAQQFTFKEYNGQDDDDLSDVELTKFFNMARCLCDADDPTLPTSFYVKVGSPGPYQDQDVYFLLGDNCDTDTNRPNCHEFNSINYSNFNVDRTLYLPVNWIVDPVDGQCKQVRDGSTLFLFMTPEKDTAVATYAIENVDTQSPDPPTVTSVTSGESALNVHWDRPTTNDEDIAYFDVLCEVNGQAPSVSSSSLADWVGTEEICGKTLTPEDIQTTDGGVDAGLDGGVDGSADLDGGVDGSADLDGGVDGSVDASMQPPAADGAADDGASQADGGAGDASAASCFGTLAEGDWPKACFVCGSAGPTATDLRISGLPNGVDVQMAVVAVDTNGNPSLVSNVMTGTPMPTNDFAEHYSEAGGKGDAGFCFVATVAYGSYDHPNVRILRRWRDGVLLHSGWGRAFVRWYYRNGRRLAAPFHGRPWARALLRAALLPLVAIAYLWTNLGSAVLAFAFFTMLAGLLFWRRRRRLLRAVAVRSTKGDAS